MSKLSNLIGKSQTFTIGGVELELKPRSLKDMDMLMDLSDDTKKSIALKKLITVTLKESTPDATDEEIEAVGLQHFKELAEAIVKVNGLSQENAITV